MGLRNFDSKAFSWADVDWGTLSSLRGRFLTLDSRSSSRSESSLNDTVSYWSSRRSLESYDFTFAQRIAWKLDSVVSELNLRGWTPPEGTVLDWGCGTGIAGRCVADAWPQQVQRLVYWDRSFMARRFAISRARYLHPKLVVSSAEASVRPGLIVISHVVNELGSTSLANLMQLIQRAQAVIWIEPGTRSSSRKLVAIRESLRDRFELVAPCTHAASCGMLSVGNERHWCHHFADVPRFVHMDPGWAQFASTLNIDLGTLPYSFLVLDRRPMERTGVEDASRVVGRIRNYKGFSKVLSCQSDGVHELMCSTRDAPGLLKELRKKPRPLYRWKREGNKIRGGTAI